MTERNDRRKENLQTLIEAGLLIPVKRGRPCLYQTDEERLAALKQQKKVCSLRYAERAKAARTLLKDLPSNVDANNLATV